MAFKHWTLVFSKRAHQRQGNSVSLRKPIAIAVFLASGLSFAAANDGAIKVSSAEKAACMPDAIRYCRAAMPNLRQVLICFGRNRSKLSERCSAVLTNYGL